MHFCPECHAELETNEMICWNCGYKIRKQKSSKLVWVIVIAVIVAGVILFVGKNFYDNVARTNYKMQIQDCAYNMIDGAADSETACNKILTVWHNSLFAIEDAETDKYTINQNGEFYDDFNDALGNLFNDVSFINQINSINHNVEQTNQTVKELQNPPKGCEQIHDAFMDFYDEYYELTNLATNPKGNYETFSNKFSEADSNSSKLFDKLTVYFD